MARTEEIKEHPRARLKAAADLVHRSFAGPIGCLFAIAMLLTSTSLWHEHPIATGLFVAAMLARIVPRVVLSLAWRRRHSEPRRYPFWMIAASTGLLSIPTGLFAAFTVVRYGFASWNTLLILVFAMSCAISGASVAAPDLKLVLMFEGTLLLPIIAGCFWTGGAHSLITGVSVSLFCTYVVLHAIRLNADYWNALAADLALRQRAEELEAARVAAEEANQAKSRFLAHMSHEIRTPMNGVLGMMELVLGTNLSAEQRDYLEDARRSAQSLLALLNDLLDHSKAESGKLALENIDFSLRQLMASAIAPFQVQANTSGIDLTCTIHEDVPEYLRGDPTRLRQVVLNLVSNALKFTEAGSVALSVAVDASAAETVTLHFLVADTGSGLPPERLDHIFEAFTQGDESITRRFGGTGLGLTICRNLIHLMGGRIWVESELGRGSLFHFTAAFAKASPLPQSGASRSSSRTGPPLGRSLRILVAEDNRVNQKLISALLSRFGHQLEVAENGAEALSRLRSNRFDVVLMDVQMPEMDGLEATRRIRAAEAESGDHLPVIGVTAGATPAELQACIRSGMDFCLTKPIQIEPLKNALARISSQCPAGLQAVSAVEDKTSLQTASESL